MLTISLLFNCIDHFLLAFETFILRRMGECFGVHLIFNRKNKSFMDLEKKLNVPLKENQGNSVLFVQDEPHSMWLMLFSRSLIMGHEKYNKTEQKKVKVDAP